MSLRVVCPYCEWDRDIEIEKEIECEIDYWEAYQLNKAGCPNCGKSFYIRNYYEITEREISKSKYN